MRVAVIGLGIMGGGMAAHLAELGHTVVAYNRTRARAEALVEKGVRVADSPRAATEASEAVILMLSDDAATRSCADGPDGVLAALRPGMLVLQMGTLAPETTLALAEEVRAKGAEILDAPVMGSAAEAAGGKMWILAGGSEETLERARPLLQDVSQNIYHAGPLGQGARLKLANNMLGANLIAALAESMTLLEAAGIDAALFTRIMVETNMGTRMLSGKAGLMRDGDYEARFSIANMRKDVGLALDLAHSLGLSLHQSESVRQPFDEAVARGLGNSDLAALRALPRQRSR